MKYLPLIIIRIKHNFYDSGNCPDFSVIADPQTARLLTNHRCRVKPDAYGFTVYVPVENEQPLIKFADDCQWSFDLKLKRDDFALYTDSRLELSNPSGLQLHQKGLGINPEQGVSTAVNADEALLSITVQRDFNNIKKLPETDEIRFFAKPVLYVYYVVTNPGNSEQLLIVDTADKTTWIVQTLSDKDHINAKLTLQYPGMTIVCFACEQTLTCRESGAQHLQLKLDGHIVFDCLPSPRYQHQTQLQTASKPTDAIYEIVTYLTDTTLIKG
ncbi:MAG: hypothetical protein WCS87_08230 [Methylococcaceae bacterium]